MTPLPIQLSRGGGRENCYRTVDHAVAENRFTTALIPFFFFFALPITEKAYMGILSITSFSKIPCLQYE